MPIDREWGEKQLVTWRERWWEFVDAFYQALDVGYKGIQSAWSWISQYPTITRYGSVLAAVGIGVLMGRLFYGAVAPQTLLLVFLPGVLLAAVAGGALAAMLASVLGALACEYYFIFPSRGAQIATTSDAIAIALYLVASTIILILYRVQERQKEEIRSFADQLEARVAERTAEMQAANEDLQGFCYSIAHDLRAPMRNLTSSTRMIIEDAGEKLDGEARDNLLSLGASANRLSQLVDDLLAHARLTSTEMKPKRVNLSDLAQEVADDVTAEPWLSTVTVRIDPKIVAHCDPSLIRLVLRNLMENSCKYSRPGQKLLIEVGESRWRGTSVYFVRDNGIGFEQQYEQKIFEPFQRLHRDVDYSGTGIGLANVKRIIERHGGRIWAEGRAGQGATFYFTLNES